MVTALHHRRLLVQAAKEGSLMQWMGSQRYEMVEMHKPFSISEERGGNGDSSMVDTVSEDDALALMLSSSTKASENASSLSNEADASFLFVKGQNLYFLSNSLFKKSLKKVKIFGDDQ
ncbi:hypothetical protein REPUB_Repub09cG0082800 [Reevesia pubescens]